MITLIIVLGWMSFVSVLLFGLVLLAMELAPRVRRRFRPRITKEQIQRLSFQGYMLVQTDDPYFGFHDPASRNTPTAGDIRKKRRA